MASIDLEFSHVGIHVHDMDAMAGFYTRVLGLVITDRGHLPGRELIFMSRNPREHHQVVLASGRTGSPQDKVINQISFRVGSLEQLRAMHQRVQAEPLATALRGVNHGNAWTLYFHDPEGNRIELFVDSPWYIAQPCSEPLDLNQPPETIRADTEAMCRAQPSFELADPWRARLAERIRRASEEHSKD